MATLAATQAEVLLLDASVPDWSIVFAVVSVLVAVTLGAGWMAELLHRERERAEGRALSDSLTGIPNRRHAGVFLEAGWGSAMRGADLSVILFDLDLFKQVNDTHGHAEGDRVIKAFGAILSERTRRMDLSARFGGEEFVTILLDCATDQAMHFAEEVRRAFEAIDFDWGHVTTSAGVATSQKGMGSPDVLLAAADQALYRAKDTGRNRVRCAETTEAAPPPKVEITTRTAVVGARCLVVDDDPAVARATAKLLTRLGAKVSTVNSAREALNRLTAGEDFDVIVTDIVMPEMSGFTLIELASRIKPGLAVLYMSGYAQEEVYWGGTPGARSAFIGKPIEVKALEASLERVLGWTGATSKEPDRAQSPSAARTAPSGPLISVAHVEFPTDARLAGQILIVDDDPGIIEVLTRVFERAGYPKPIGVSNPLLVPNIVAQGGIDLLITDMHMPGMNGLQLLEQLSTVQNRDEYFPVLMLTSDPDHGLRRRALATGASDFLSKPFDTLEAEARVRNLLATRAMNVGMSGQRDLFAELVRERTSELADTRTEILHRLARAAEYRDDITGRHAERVGMMASLIGAEFGMSAREVDLIRRTAPLHDVGKIGVPDSILRKPGRLTASEFDIMRAHTTIGGQILGGSQHAILQCASAIALSHHERYDGKGYPHGLSGEAIPVEARIVAVADVFDVLVHTRPYKGAMPMPEAVAEMARSSGSHFDPILVEAFMTIYDRVGPADILALADPIHPLSDTEAPRL